MGMPSISITTIGTALTVIRENTISPVSCMIPSIEALKTQIDGPTLLRARVEISHIITSLRSMECTSIDASSSASKSIYSIKRWEVIVRVIATYGGRTKLTCFPASILVCPSLIAVFISRTVDFRAIITRIYCMSVSR